VLYDRYLPIQQQISHPPQHHPRQHALEHLNSPLCLASLSLSLSLLLPLFVSWISDEGAGTAVSNYPKQIPRCPLAFNVRACVAARTLLLRLTRVEAARMFDKGFYSSIIDKRLLVTLDTLANRIAIRHKVEVDLWRSMSFSKTGKRDVENLPLGISQGTDPPFRRKN